MASLPRIWEQKKIWNLLQVQENVWNIAPMNSGAIEPNHKDADKIFIT